MTKSLLLAAAAVVGVSTVATVYYVSPVGVVANETPPILVDLPVADAVRTIRTIRLDSYIQHFGANRQREREEIGSLVALVRHDISDTETIFEIMRGSDLLMQFRVVVKPVGSQSEIAIDAVARESKFRAASSLHPSDIVLLQSVADFLATDYVSSLVKGHPMLSGERLEYELERRYGQDADSSQAAVRRIKDTFVATYAEEMRDEAESFAESSDDSYDVDDGEADNGSEPATDASADTRERIAADEAATAANAATAEGGEDW